MIFDILLFQQLLPFAPFQDLRTSVELSAIGETSVAFIALRSNTSSAGKVSMARCIYRVVAKLGNTSIFNQEAGWKV